MSAPENCQLNYYDLPLCRLHVMEAGDGPPLIMVPATISECREYVSLTRFMAQWFHVYFFELPGHGESTPFHTAYRSDLVAETLEHFVDSRGFQRFSLMGFSFGGILALKTYDRMSERVDNLILLSPCLNHHAVLLSRARKGMILGLHRVLNRPSVQAGLIRMLHSPHTVDLVYWFLRKIGRLESTIKIRPKLLTISKSTVQVLNYQFKEIMTIEFPVPAARHTTPCFMAMSVNDPVLDFETTLAVLKSHFADVNVVRLDYPYHQPPAPFTYEGLNRDFYAIVNEFMNLRKVKM